MTNQCGVVRARHAVPYRSTPARRRVTSCDAGQPHAHSAAAGRRWDHKSSPPRAAMLRAEEAHGLRLAALFGERLLHLNRAAGRIGSGDALGNALLERRPPGLEPRLQTIARGVGRVIAFRLEHVFHLSSISRQSWYASNEETDTCSDD